MLKDRHILTINGGSSSIKFSLYKTGTPLQLLFKGQIENIGAARTQLACRYADTKEISTTDINAAHHTEAADSLIAWLDKQDGMGALHAIAHRIVHGMRHTLPEVISPELIKELKQISAYDPEHLPTEIRLVEAFVKRYPAVLQVACFDTAFHTTMPPVAKMLSIPRRYFDKGIQRYGFHGLSYTYLLQELEHLAGATAARGKVILAHLGNGASLAAIKDGKSVDTSMGFTPTSGLPMGTRTGDLDPGVAWYTMELEKLNPQQFNHLINHESGLLGISGTSADMRELQELENTDSRAADAIAFFCYHTRKWLGAYTAVLGGLETLVFSGGIGEHSPEVRSKICDGLEFLGIELDEIKNMQNEAVISTPASKVMVRVIHTNEELVMAKLVYDMVKMEDRVAVPADQNIF